MIWQDIVFSFGGLVLALGLLPMFRAPEPPPLQTSLPLMIVLGVFTVAMATLGLWFGAVGMALQAVLWLMLAARALAPSTGGGGG